MPRSRSGLPPSSSRREPAGAAERDTFDELYATVYEELRRLASSVRRGESSSTLTPTALVNEAWLKLSNSPQLAQTSRADFKAIAGYAMRQVLVEAARRRHAKKRSAALLVPLDDSIEGPPARGEDVLALDAALRDLSRLHPRQAAVVEGRFFGGLEIEELAAWLRVSASTVRSDWRVARAWLHAQLSDRSAGA